MASTQSGAVAKPYKTWLGAPAEDDNVRDQSFSIRFHGILDP
ncbi:hypothetical protein [Streptomyces sp. NBC_00996]|nr:hypothetical protein OG390_34860 [Streptomyces sp. NBC_00996]